MAKREPVTKTVKGKEQAQVEMVGLDIGKVPPQAIDMEEAVLGALLLEPNASLDIVGLVKPEYFYKENHRKIFAAIVDLVSAHNPVDIYTVAEELKKNNLLDEIGGPYYLSQLTMRVAAASHLEYHSKVLTQKFIQRELISTSYGILRDAFDDTIPADELLDASQQKLFELGEMNLRRDTRPVRSVLGEVLDELSDVQTRDDGLSGLPSGYTSLDRMTLGWQKADLVVVAARPSMGKTAFVLTMARNMTVNHNIPVAFFSLEMPDAQLVKRLLVSETGLSSEKIRGGKKLKNFEWEQLNQRIINLTKAPLYIDDTPSLSIFEFRAKARRLVAHKKVKLIIVDYMQLMAGPPELRGMREQEVAAISRSLKAVAKELNIPIVALSQMNRASETRGGHRKPQLSDLRESGAIEQDADIVIFLYRPEYYGIREDESGHSLEGIAEVILAKHRNGAIGEFQMRFRSREIRFMDIDEGGPDFVPDEPVTYASRMNQMNDLNDNFVGL
ncbi:MAG TPA: replicative DNA helicase [Bacteroidales bacterium]|nr:MAG: Replicative DNA helicase [Bacteroidetes bacterium ADurb.Bin037]HPV87841.1 replicative DNA helicase [Bacteroidales bacterium]HPW78116.1 replicative DNA helicase [Bacteroidales bacterium]HQB56544.1 replicative DNA helicase [Bacteroidales bacterium]